MGTNTGVNDNFSVDINQVDGLVDTQENLDIQHYIRILRKHKWPISLFTALLTVLAVYYAHTATPMYSATSTLLIESQRQDNIVSIQELVGGESESSDYYQTQFQLLRSRSLAIRVIDHLNLWSHPEISPAEATRRANEGVGGENSDAGVSTGLFQSWVDNIEGVFTTNTPSTDVTDLGEQATSTIVIDLDDASTTLETLPLTTSSSSIQRSDLTERQQNAVIGRFMSRLEIVPTRGTKLVQISFVSEDPKFAVTVANTVGEQYIDSYLDSKLEMTARASNWLNGRLSELKLELDTSEDKLIAYKQDNGLVDVNGSVGRLNEQELLLATTELAEARSSLASASDIYNAVRAAQGQPDLLINLSAIQGDGLIQGVRQEQGQRQRELDELLNRYGDRHPRVVDARSRLESLNSTMDGHVSRVTGSISKNYQLLQQRVSNIEAKLARGKEEILIIGTKRFELDELEREVATKRDLYNTFYSRITEAKSADGLETANARITDYAITPGGPFKPQKQLIIGLAALAALVLSVLMAFLYEMMDTTVKSIHDIEDRIGLKLLGILPLIKTKKMFSSGKRTPLNPTNMDDKKGSFLEAINTIRTAITMEDASAPRKVIMITSSVPGEGKSTTSINLAFSMAQMQRVLLVDCDMRRPSIGAALGLPRNAFGLSNLIMGTASAEQCIQRGAFDGYVDVLPAGLLPVQPLELISSARFAKIIEKFREHYDRIIIDCAPTQAVSDALVLSKLSDAVIYAIKSHDTDVSLVQRGIQRLSQNNAPLAGVVITQVDIDKITGYGGDYYYQGYYDYYGYNDNAAPSKNKLTVSQQELTQLQTDDREIDLGLDFFASDQNGEVSRKAMKREAADLDLTQEIDTSKSRSASKSNLEFSKKLRDDLDII